MYKLPFSEQSPPRVILQASCTSLTLHQPYCLLNPDVDPSEFQEWHNKTQEMEKPNGKTKQIETPAFFKHFSPSFLKTKPT